MMSVYDAKHDVEEIWEFSESQHELTSEEENERGMSPEQSATNNKSLSTNDRCVHFKATFYSLLLKAKSIN